MERNIWHYTSLKFRTAIKKKDTMKMKKRQATNRKKIFAKVENICVWQAASSPFPHCTELQREAVPCFSTAALFGLNSGLPLFYHRDKCFFAVQASNPDKVSVFSGIALLPCSSSLSRSSNLFSSYFSEEKPPREHIYILELMVHKA